MTDTPNKDIASLSFEAAMGELAKTEGLSPEEAGIVEQLEGHFVMYTLVARPAAELACDDPSALDLSDPAVEVIVHRLRRKLEGSGAEIRTVRGFGYLLCGAAGGP